MQGGLRMYNIVVCCVSALSSSILVSKMKEVAREKGVKALIWTVGIIDTSSSSLKRKIGS